MQVNYIKIKQQEGFGEATETERKLDQKNAGIPQTIYLCQILTYKRTGAGMKYQPNKGSEPMYEPINTNV